MFDFSSQRRFSIWAATSSHSQVLLRSNQSSDHLSRIEVLFKGTRAIKLNFVLEGLHVKEAIGDDAQRIRSDAGIDAADDDRYFLIVSGARSGYVVASHVATTEDEAAYHEPSNLLSDAHL